jgi:hypothetical protein
MPQCHIWVLSGSSNTMHIRKGVVCTVSLVDAVWKFRYDARSYVEKCSNSCSIIYCTSSGNFINSKVRTELLRGISE